MSALKPVTIYTDGACTGNPGAGGYGVVLRFGNHCRELSAGYRRTTNNRMEILAVIAALSALKETCRVSLYSDSEYVVKMMAEGWPRKWEANGWRRSNKEKASNTDLWSRLLRLCDEHEVEFHWVKGHANNTDNERCDRLAVIAAQQLNLPVDEGYELVIA